MFDMKAEISLNLPSPEGRKKKILVRYPSDNEFIEWRRKKKIFQKDLGGRSFQIESARAEPCDLALFNAIRLDKEEDAHADEAEALAEAFHVISQLAHAEVADRPERDGSLYVIEMKVMRKSATSHRLQVPSVKEMMDYERQRSGVVFGAYGRQEIRINWGAFADLYDKLKQSTQGYSGNVPVPHKAEAINVLLQEIRAEQEETPESDDEDEG